MRFSLPTARAQLFLVGLITILFEVIFTRLASAYFQYHYAFAILSLAMLSFCLSGVIYQAAPAKEKERIFGLLLPVLPACFLLLLVILAVYALILSPNPLGLAAIMILLILIGFGILFICGFLTVSLLDNEKEAGIAYGINLLGSGAGGLAAVILLSFWDPYKGLAICSIAGVFWALMAGGRKWALFAVILLAVSLFFLFLPIKNIDLVWEGWNSFSRVTVDDAPAECLMWGGENLSEEGLPGSFMLKIDSNAATAIVLEPEKAGILAKDVTHAGYYFLKDGSTVAIIGSGGGRDVVAAKQFNLSGIKAIEINPLVVQAVNLFSPQTYGGVDTVVADGREALVASPQKFSLVQLSLVDTWAAVSSGSHALTENYLYTEEAFGTYLDGVDEGGIVSITYWDSYRDKLLSLAFAAMNGCGVENPSENVIVFKQGSVSTILIKKGAWAQEELSLAEKVAEENDYQLIMPDAVYPGRVNTDDSPFFFFNELGVLNLAAIVIILVFIFLINGGRLISKMGKCGRGTLLYFALIGLGFMAVESVFIQRFLLAIHNPTITVALVFTSFLAFGGFGSLLSKKIDFRYSVAIVPLLVLFAFGWEGIIPALYGMDIASKAAVSVCLIAPFAFLMGTFFPRGMAYLKDKGLDEMGSAWSINGIASVFAPIITILVAAYIGFSAALLVAALAYLCSWALGMGKFRSS